MRVTVTSSLVHMQSWVLFMVLPMRALKADGSLAGKLPKGTLATLAETRPKGDFSSPCSRADLFAVYFPQWQAGTVHLHMARHLQWFQPMVLQPDTSRLPSLVPCLLQIPENPPDYQKYYRHMNKVGWLALGDGIRGSTCSLPRMGEGK